MTTKFKFAVAALVAFVPAASMAQESVAVALSASLQPVEMTNTTDYSGVQVTGTAEIPVLDVIGKTNEVNGHSHGASSGVGNLRTKTGQATVTGQMVEGSTATETTETMQLTSISIAAAAGEVAVASAVANGEGNTGANAGSSNNSREVSATVMPWFGGDYTSRVMVSGEQHLQ